VCWFYESIPLANPHTHEDGDHNATRKKEHLNHGESPTKEIPVVGRGRSYRADTTRIADPVKHYWI
jgi:hypothetical protein